MRLNEQQARERAEQLTAELEEANVQLAAYATQAEELAMTQERNRLAREIHDNLGHYLTIVNVQIEAARVVMESDPDRALDAMNKAQELTQKGLARVRESVAALRESPVSNRPLGEAIASLVKEAQSSGIVTEFKVTGEPLTLEHKVALALYRAAQEGLTNVRKHARASRVDVLLDYQPDQVRLEVRDNGVGAAETAGGFGLLGIRERMQLLGGRAGDQYRCREGILPDGQRAAVPDGPAAAARGMRRRYGHSCIACGRSSPLSRGTGDIALCPQRHSGRRTGLQRPGSGRGRGTASSRRSPDGRAHAGTGWRKGYTPAEGSPA